MTTRDENRSRSESEEAPVNWETETNREAHTSRETEANREAHTSRETHTNREAHQAVEAIVMVAEEPVAPGLMAQLIEIPTEQVEAICAQLAEEYRAERRGFELVRVAGGYRFRSHPDTEAYVKRFVVSGQSDRLSSAALETLAIVAYKQPLSRAQVSAIRGVNAEGAVRTLQQRGLVHEVGRDPGPGNARLFATTPAFLERLDLDSIHDLPPLVDFVPGPEVIEALETSLMADSRPSTDGDGSSA